MEVEARRVQCAWRANASRFELRWRMLQDKHEEKREKRRQAALRIQKVERGRKGRRLATTRRVQVEREKQASKVVSLEQEVDAFVQDDTDNISHLTRCAATIQSGWRAYNARFEVDWRRAARCKAHKLIVMKQELEEINEAQTSLLRFSRGMAARCSLARIHHDSVNSKRVDRANQMQANKTALTIQRCFKKYVERRNKWFEVIRAHKVRKTSRASVIKLSTVKRTEINSEDPHCIEALLIYVSTGRLAATAIQCWWRRILARRRVIILRQERKKAAAILSARQDAAAVTIQQCYRRYRRVRFMALFFKNKAEIAKREATIFAVITIQRVLRGTLGRFKAEMERHFKEEERIRKNFTLVKRTAFVVTKLWQVKLQSRKKNR
eukprot:TRINITY_DN19980_c0_g1_i1.p1 TRINITY_DN19980_c0_g1~~TRINITY_DN19980_c0_g1_i1.p1  ORF type:complete len:381 (+),score=58.76 TRINITY_DN19980_c0_g1_i1:167-1309(+)